ncbi:MAG TPA: molybdopterin-binding oxidoreductase, partial [Acidimicrobiia bacterium]|nr:molybdopterin-binding oxidoreductase [Acidimicrobiia bacterium]
MRPRSRSASAGALAAGLALAIAELAAGFAASVPSLVQEVGDVVIDNVPTPVKDWAISVFGVYDKLALVVGIVVVTLLIGAAVGVLARRRLWVAVVAFAGFGVLGAAAAVVEGESVSGSVIGAGIAALSGLLCLTWLYGRIEADAAQTEQRTDAGRRAFITGAGAVITVAALSAGAG